jgi:thiol-disulfide isomerase/thioredoxin
MVDRLRRYSWLLACFLLFPSAHLQAQAADSPPVKKQLPADVRAYRAARAVTDPEKRLAAMRSFIKDYPKSSRASSAEDQILKILLESFPQQTTEIAKQAKLQVKHAAKGSSRLNQETYTAFALAEGGTAGVDLPLAEKLAKDAVDHLSESAFAKEMNASYTKYKHPAPKPDVQHRYYANTRAEALAVLADVYLREGKPAQATPLIAEAFTLDPLVDDVNSQRARLALVNHDDALALDSFERAQLVGAISIADRRKMMELYRAEHGGSEAAFNADMDARYAQLFPVPFTPGKPSQVSTHHAVLLELFTGSACGPCVGGDLAVDAVLNEYPRSEVVALAFDQHIPDPDPLANPDSVARADIYEIPGTPTFVLDGQVQDLYGSDRNGSEQLYDKLTKLVDANAALPSSVEIKVSVDAAPDGAVHGHAHGQLPGAEEIAKIIAAKPKLDAPAVVTKTAAKTPAAPAPVTATAEPHLVVNFALVEDEIRYSGENGIRFHRMVVRSLAKPADSGFPVTANSTFNLDASFDPSEISTALSAYLDDY